MLKATLFELYDLAPCTLWVEDELTRAVLTELWGDTAIRIYSAAGAGGVEHLVRAAPKGFAGKNVFGLLDRDFSVAVRPLQPPSMNTALLYAPGHEIENSLLDFDVLSHLTHNPKRSSAAIEADAKSFATELTWWMACKHVLYDFRAAMTASFPSDPDLPDPVFDRSQAIRHVNASGFRQNHNMACHTWTPGYIEAELDKWKASYEADIGSGAWLKTFSGKELFRRVRSTANLKAEGKTAAEKDADLGVRIARQWRKKSKPPPLATELKAIRTDLRDRAGL